jgi:hypothetical protein
VWHSQQKEMFICDTLEPIMSNHRLLIDRRVIEQTRRSSMTMSATLSTA